MSMFKKQIFWIVFKRTKSKSKGKTKIVFIFKIVSNIMFLSCHIYFIVEHSRNKGSELSNKQLNPFTIIIVKIFDL